LVDSGAIARGSGAAAAGKEGVAVAGYIVGDVLGPGARKKVHYCAPGAISPDCIRIAYLKRLIHECGMLPLLGLGTSVGHAGANQVGDMPLWTTYIHPDTTQQPVTQMPSPQQKMDHPKCREAVERRQACTALEAVARFPYLVVTGKPGAGKSTFATHLIRCLAAHNLPPEESPFAFDLSKHLPGLTLDPGLLPVRVTLRGFARDLPSDAHKGTAHLLWQYILRSLAPLDEFGGSLKDALLRGRALVVLDGLDEVPETSREGKVSPRRLVLQAVEDFALCNFDSRNARYLVTCRTASYIPPWTLDGFKEAELAEFDLEKQDHFCQLWYTELARRGQLDESEVEEKVAGLRRAIRRPDLERISGNPLLLTVMALVHAREPELPEARALLYEKCVDVLLWLWERRKEDEGCPADLSTLLQEAGVARTSFARVLGRLAYDVHMRVHAYERKNS
jgi:predicted NACHT family NTPase